jgi:hypothetical protein
VDAVSEIEKKSEKNAATKQRPGELIQGVEVKQSIGDHQLHVYEAPLFDADAASGSTTLDHAYS